MEEKKQKRKDCPDCKGLGYIQEEKGKPVHVCFRCLKLGLLG
jgi:hypothetical protein